MDGISDDFEAATCTTATYESSRLVPSQPGSWDVTSLVRGLCASEAPFLLIILAIIYPEMPWMLLPRMSVSHRDETFCYQHKTKWSVAIDTNKNDFSLPCPGESLLQYFASSVTKSLQKYWQWGALLRTWKKGGGEQQKQQTQTVCDAKHRRVNINLQSREKRAAKKRPRPSW